MRRDGSNGNFQAGKWFNRHPQAVTATARFGAKKLQVSHMTDETLSALLDEECSPAELDHLLEAMEREPALKARYSRMCLVRDSLHGGGAKSVHSDFSARVLAALDQEPVSTVVPFRTRRYIVWQPLAGLAAAAALAAVAVLLLRPESSLAPDTRQAAVAQPAQSADKADRHWTELDADKARQLNDYLIAYSRSRAEQGVGGTLSLVRYAALTVEPQQQEPHR